MFKKDSGKICYIAGAGDPAGFPFKPAVSDYVIAADGGLKLLESFGVNPDLIIGDFDSLGYVPGGENVITLPAAKDDTDMMFAVKSALKCGYNSFVIYGGLGGRLDHTLANIQLLCYIADNKARGYLIGDGFEITAVKNGSIEFDKTEKGYISVFSAGETAEGVNLSGLKYSLTDATLTNTVSVGVSNEFTGHEAKITVANGTLIIIYGISKSSPNVI